MKRFAHRFTRMLMLTAVSLLAFACGHDSHSPDPLKMSRVDGLNKKSFVCRYKDPVRSVQLAEEALKYLNDSLPDYADGYLRTWNNLAFGNYMLTHNDVAEVYIDSVLSSQHRCDNAKIEKVIARLIMARIYQMDNRIADSYLTLYEIDNEGSLDRYRNNILYNFAQTEYYITTLNLNYTYRNGMEESVAEQIEEIESQRGKLPCDYAQDLSLYYALAYGYSRLCDSLPIQSSSLGHSLDCCISSLEMLRNPDAYSTHELANVVQMFAFLGCDEKITDASWADNSQRWYDAMDILTNDYNIVIDTSYDLILQLFEISTDLFHQCDDPNQRLSSSEATGRYCLQIHDTLLAQQYYLMQIYDTLQPSAEIPRYESMLYDGLLRSGAGSFDQRMEWYDRFTALKSVIDQNQKADFELQTELDRSHITTRISLIFALILVVFLIGLVMLIVKLNHQRRALKKEARRLKEAQQQDVERIANVETCLSVMRHDISPFMSYLQNKNLPAELRNEVQQQLVRTFDNIKNWTNLSIPTGLQYKGSTFPIQEAFDLAQNDVNNIRGNALEVVFEPSQLMVNGDKLLLEILLRNLVNNAIQHTLQGEVRIRAVEEDAFVHVTVTDTGSGMNADQIESLFRADKQPHSDGDHSGFGLILCRYIIKKHDDNTLRGCRIWAESQEGHGSTFHFLIAKSK